MYAGFGDAYYQLGEYARAADAYEKALPEIELHMGRNNFYEIVSENLKQTYARLGGGRPEERGLRLCERYYIAFGNQCWNGTSGRSCRGWRSVLRGGFGVSGL